MSLRQVHFASVDLELHARFQPGQVGAANTTAANPPARLALLRLRAQALPSLPAHLAARRAPTLRH